MTDVKSYSCPSCGSPLEFSADTQHLHCNACGNDFDRGNLDELLQTDEEMSRESRFDWDSYTPREYTPDDTIRLSDYACPSCGAEITGDDTLGAAVCPYCGGATIIKKQFEGTLKPDLVIPFKIDKKTAVAKFKEACKKAPFLPDSFTEEKKLEEMSGLYVPFWLFGCDCDATMQFSAEKITCWSDSKYDYTKTDHYRLIRAGEMGFDNLPVDGSLAIDNDYMEALEPFEYEDAVPFDTAFLAGFLANKYDVSAKECEPRANERIEESAERYLRDTTTDFQGVCKEKENVSFSHGKVRYALLPVWMLSMRYEDKVYRYAVNGQTGKVVGEYPTCKKKKRRYFRNTFAIWALITLGVVAVLELLSRL